MSPLRRKPIWWSWDFVISEHAEERMDERGVSESRLRWMLQPVRRVTRSDEPGRFVVEVSVLRARWEVVLEPDFERQVVVIVTVYNAGWG